MQGPTAATMRAGRAPRPRPWRDHGLAIPPRPPTAPFQPAWAAATTPRLRVGQQDRARSRPPGRRRPAPGVPVDHPVASGRAVAQRAVGRPATMSEWIW